jgi:hypothetical protein
MQPRIKLLCLAVLLAIASLLVAWSPRVSNITEDAVDFDNCNGISGYEAGGAAWSNPENAEAQDGSYAVADAATGTKWLWCRDFGFDLEGVTSIDGITVSRWGFSENPNLSRGENLKSEMSLVQGTLCSGYIGNKRNVSFLDGIQSGYQTDPGSTTDKWGTSVDGGDVSDPSFGVAWWENYDNNMGAAELDLDQIVMTIYYTSEDGERRSQTRAARDITIRQ